MEKTLHGWFIHFEYFIYIKYYKHVKGAQKLKFVASKGITYFEYFLRFLSVLIL